MAKKIPARTSQFIMVADFNFNYNDWMVDTVDGAKKTFGSTVALAVDPAEPGLLGPAAQTGLVAMVIPMPAGAVIIGGAVIVETAYVGPTAATLSVGVSGTPVGLASAVDLKTVGRTALLLTSPLICNAGQNVIVTYAHTVTNATAGRVRVRVDYSIDNRSNEVLIA